MSGVQARLSATILSPGQDREPVATVSDGDRPVKRSWSDDVDDQQTRKNEPPDEGGSGKLVETGENRTPRPERVGRRSTPGEVDDLISLPSGPPSTGFRSASRPYLRRAPHRRQVPQHFDLSAPDHQPAEVRLKRTAVYLGSSGCEVAIYWLAPVLRGGGTSACNRLIFSPVET